MRLQNIDCHIVLSKLTRQARERESESTYFFYLLVVLLESMLDIPAIPLCNFRLGFLRLFVFRLFDPLSLVCSLGHSHDAHSAVSIGDHHLDGFSLDVLVKITRINCQVEIVLAAHVIVRGALIVRYAHAILIRRGTIIAITVVELIIVIQEITATRELIIGTVLSAELLAIRLFVNGITISVALVGGDRRSAVARGRFDLERFLVILEIVERAAISTAVSVAIVAQSSATTEHRRRWDYNGIGCDARVYASFSVMIMMVNVLLNSRGARLMQNYLFLVDELVLEVRFNIARFVCRFGRE